MCANETWPVVGTDNDGGDDECVGAPRLLHRPASLAAGPTAGAQGQEARSAGRTYWYI